MSDKSKLEWTDASWNLIGSLRPARAERIAYAATFAERFRRRRYPSRMLRHAPLLNKSTTRSTGRTLVESL